MGRLLKVPYATVDNAAGIDAAEIRRAVAVLADPRYAIAFRGLRSGREATAPGDDPDAAVQAALSLAGDRNLYYVLNPVALDHKGSTNASHILYRRWWLADTDPDKAPGHEDDMATEAEKAAAMEVVAATAEGLRARGWPEPVEVDSGNGGHLLYRIDLPNDADSRNLLRACLEALGDLFDAPGGRIDRKVFDAPRIAKLPGSTARKGDSTPERPHRPCRLLSVPDVIEVVTREQLEALAAERKPAAPSPAPKPAPDYTPSAGIPPYAAAVLSRELGRISSAPAGERNVSLNDAAFRLFTMAANPTFGLPVDLVESECTSYGLAIGLAESEVRATVASAKGSGMAQPRPDLPVKEQPKLVRGKKPPPLVEGPYEEAVSYPASEVTPTKVRWLWPGRIPLGKLTTFAGHGGLGKTFVLCDITARVTTGAAWPDGSPGSEPGGVLFVSGEDDPDDTLVPRMIELGVDRELVRFLNDKSLAKFTLAHLEMLDKALSECQAHVRLVVIDPPTAYLAGVDDHKNADLRQLLTPLKERAKRWDCSIVFNTHVNKGGNNVEAMARVMGSVAWVNAVRAAHMFAKDPDDPLRRLCIPMKNNLGPERKGLAYRIVGRPDDMAAVEWLGDVDTTADQAVAPAKKKSRDEKAAEWLVERFREKPEWHSDDLFKAGRQCGISRDAIFEAKAALDLPKPRKVTSVEGNVAWVWWVPPDWTHFNRTGVAF